MADTKPQASEAIDARLVRKLADILNDTGLTEIEVERGDLKIRVAREITRTLQAAPMAYAPAAPAGPAMAVSAPPVPSAGVTAPAAAAVPAPGEVVTSPMVGTIYHQAQPGAPSFIKVGDTVSAGQTLMIVEAMKTMNPIPAPRGGRVIEILVDDAQPVEFGEPLVVIE